LFAAVEGLYSKESNTFARGRAWKVKRVCAFQITNSVTKSSGCTPSKCEGLQSDPSQVQHG